MNCNFLGADRHLDIGLQVVEAHPLLKGLFREAFSHPYISFFHLLVNGFSVTCFRTFFAEDQKSYLLLIDGRYCWAG